MFYSNAVDFQFSKKYIYKIKIYFSRAHGSFFKIELYDFLYNINPLVILHIKKSIIKRSFTKYF